MRVPFEALQNLCTVLTAKKKIYSDSTLRLNNQLALSSDGVYVRRWNWADMQFDPAGSPSP